jgi:hypothetical protein
MKTAKNVLLLNLLVKRKEKVVIKSRTAMYRTSIKRFKSFYRSARSVGKRKALEAQKEGLCLFKIKNPHFKQSYLKYKLEEIRKNKKKNQKDLTLFLINRLLRN